MLSDLLRRGKSDLRLAQAGGKCSRTSSNFGEILLDLLRLGENALKLA